MSLDEYKRKRDFSRTSEPVQEEATASPPNSDKRVFVVQKHAASRLHYDFRLETGGVLASWAVPKGPSLDTRDRRLAVHVEDHPIEYGSFEGTIPQGEYGGGTVMVWDRGTYEPVGDFDEDYSAGRAIKFVLHGDKLNGGYTLVHMKPREGDHAENWLLIKERDEYVRPREEYDIVEARPESVASGRDMDQIASASDAQRLSQSAREIPMQLASLVDTAPEGAMWIHEVKYDGYRTRAWLSDGIARLYTRTGQDWSDRFEPIATAVASLPASSALLDGEVVVLDHSGVPDFAALQHALSTGDGDALDYVVFDLLALDGWDLRGTPLKERKELLRSLLESAEEPGPLVFAEHVEGNGTAFHDATCDLDLEGSVSKRADAPYRPGRTPDWRKVKCLQRQEFVAGGWTEPGGSRHGFGALLLGVYEGDRLAYAGRVGTGFSERMLDELTGRLESLETAVSPFQEEPDVPGKLLHWVTPRLVVEVRFQEWTPEGLLRHPSFVGLRDDKPAEEVIREGASPTKATKTTTPTDAHSPVQTTADSAGTETALVAGVRITSPEKVLFASTSDTGPGVTKVDLARYYERVAERLLIHAGGRPLTLVRCPHGQNSDCFYQKHPDAKGFPEAIRTVQILDRDGPAEYLYVDDAAGVISLVQLGVLEIHAWNSRVDDAEHPDRIVFDLDPGAGVSWRQLADAAHLIHAALLALGLGSFLKSTGGKGLHVVAPIVAEHDHDTVRRFAHAFVDHIVQHDPDSFTARMAKSARPGRVFLDYLRNAHGATAVAAFSTRARPGAPISLPLRWSELEDDTAPVLGIEEVERWFESHAEDPWSDYEEARIGLEPEMFAALGVVLQDRQDR